MMLAKWLTLFLDRRNCSCTIAAHIFDVAVWPGSYHALLTIFELRGEPNWCCALRYHCGENDFRRDVVQIFRMTLNRNTRNFMRMFFFNQLNRNGDESPPGEIYARIKDFVFSEPIIFHHTTANASAPTLTQPTTHRRQYDNALHHIATRTNTQHRHITPHHTTPNTFFFEACTEIIGQLFLV